jgi:hypothetical protein
LEEAASELTTQRISSPVGAARLYAMILKRERDLEINPDVWEFVIYMPLLRSYGLGVQRQLAVSAKFREREGK